MARASVELIVEAAKAVNPLRRVQKEALTVQQRLDKTNETTRKVAQGFQYMGNRAKRALRDAESSAGRLGKRMSGLRVTVAKVAIGFAAFSSAQAGLARAESERRIRLLAESYGEVSELQEAAAAAADKFKLSQTEANQAIGNAFARLRPLGVSLEDITSTFSGFRTAAVLGGATAQEASAAFTQLSQALGSGALRGDEFRSVAEQAPLVLKAISDETGVAAGQLKEYAADGLLTSDIVIKALKRIESEGAEKLTEALDGPAAKIKEFQNATQDVQVALTEAVIPELARSFVILADIINDLKPAIQAVGDFAAKVLGGIAGTIERIRDPNKLATEQQEFLARGEMLGRMRRGERGLPNFGPNYKAQELALFAAAERPTKTTTTPPTSIIKPPTKGGTSTSAADPLASLKKQIAALKEGVLLARTRTEQEERQQQLLNDIAALASIRTDANAHLVDEAIRLTGELFYQKGLQREALELDKQIAKNKEEARRLELQEAAVLQNIYQNTADTIANGVVGALRGAVDGTKSLADAATDMLTNLSNQMIQLLQNLAFFGNLTGTLVPGGGILGGIFGGLMAKGGTVTGGRSYIVGEEGPELFTPGRTGSIAPSGSFGGANVVVNVDASGSQAQGNEPNAKALGAAIGAAVQAELVKQKRPGGLLS
jgi:tape measure domain-containing protein